MKLLSLLVIVLANRSSGIDNFFNEKSCFKRFVSNNNNNNLARQNGPSSNCEVAVNLKLDELKSSTKEPCVFALLNKKDVAESLLRQYLRPQLENHSNLLAFGENFTEFREKSVKIARVVCTNKAIFRPDVAELMREAKRYRESRASELSCIEIFIKNPNTPLTAECQKVKNYARNDFYRQMDQRIKIAFRSPNDQLISPKCLREKAEEHKFFERVYYSVVLVTKRNLNDRQIDTFARASDITIGNSQKIIFECIK
jgi:hypothetical protein